VIDNLLIDIYRMEDKDGAPDIKDGLEHTTSSEPVFRIF
jgi:hypothetical protein